MKCSQHETDFVGWESLPIELIQLVCEWLPFGKVLRLNEVCSLWKAALDDEMLWRRRYTQSFGPLSSWHLVLPRPAHLQGEAATSHTSKRLLNWKKRFFVMRNCKRSNVQIYSLLHGCPIVGGMSNPLEAPTDSS